MARAATSSTKRTTAKSRRTTTDENTNLGTRDLQSVAIAKLPAEIQRGVRACRQAMNAVLNAMVPGDRPAIEAGFKRVFFGAGTRTATSAGGNQARALSAGRGGTRSATSTGRGTAKTPSRSRASPALKEGTRSARSSGGTGQKMRSTPRSRRAARSEEGQSQQTQGTMENQQQQL